MGEDFGGSQLFSGETGGGAISLRQQSIKGRLEKIDGCKMRVISMHLAVHEFLFSSTQTFFVFGKWLQFVS